MHMQPKEHVYVCGTACVLVDSLRASLLWGRGTLPYDKGSALAQQVLCLLLVLLRSLRRQHCITRMRVCISTCPDNHAAARTGCLQAHTGGPPTT
jgi:hypothetical protein